MPDLAFLLSLSQDVSVLAQGLLSSISIYTMLTSSSLVQCNADGGTSALIANPYILTHSLCGAFVDLSSVLRVFVAMVVVTNVAFLLAILLRHFPGLVAPRGATLISFSLVISALISTIAKFSLLAKVPYLPLLFQCDTSGFTGLAGPSGACNKKVVSDGPRTALECSSNCKFGVPVEVSILTSTYVFSMLYILYLVFEFQAKAVDAGSPAENLLAEYSSGAVMGRILPGDAPAISGQAKELLLEACKVLEREGDDRKRFWWGVVQDGAALIKFCLAYSSIVIFLLASSRSAQQGVRPACSPLQGDGVFLDIGLLTEECGAILPRTLPKVFSFSSAGAVLLLIFVFAIAAEKRAGSLGRSLARTISGATVLLVFSAFIGQFVLIEQLQKSEILFSCFQTSAVSQGGFGLATNVTVSALCARRDINITATLQPLTQQNLTAFEGQTYPCHKSCRVRTPPPLAFLESNVVVSVMFLVLISARMLGKVERTQKKKR